MSITISPPPAPPPKKRGLGCVGCGCLMLAVVLILVIGIMGLVGYSTYETVIGMTSTSPTKVPAGNDSDDLYQRVRQKLGDFQHDVVNHQAATVKFSADEINTMLAHNPDMAQKHIQAYVSFTGNQARLQTSFPTDEVSHGLIPGRFTSFDLTFEIHFNQVTRQVNVIPQSFQVEDKQILGADSDNPQANQAVMRAFSPVMDQQLNAAIRKSSDGAALLDQAKSIEVQDGQLVIETR